jgi:hypothetical protein
LVGTVTTSDRGSEHLNSAERLIKEQLRPNKATCYSLLLMAMAHSFYTDSFINALQMDGWMDVSNEMYGDETVNDTNIPLDNSCMYLLAK